MKKKIRKNRPCWEFNLHIALNACDDGELRAFLKCPESSFNESDPNLAKLSEQKLEALDHVRKWFELEVRRVFWQMLAIEPLIRYQKYVDKQLRELVTDVLQRSSLEHLRKRITFRPLKKNETPEYLAELEIFETKIIKSAMKVLASGRKPTKTAVSKMMDYPTSQDSYQAFRDQLRTRFTEVDFDLLINVARYCIATNDTSIMDQRVHLSPPIDIKHYRGIFDYSTFPDKK